MASDADIKKMLIEALRPSIREIVAEEVAEIAGWRGEVAEVTEDLRREVADLRKVLTEEIAARTRQVLTDLQRSVAQEVDGRLSNIRQQFILSTSEIHALRDEIAGRIARASDRVDALDRRLRAAAAALESQPDSAMPAK